MTRHHNHRGPEMANKTKIDVRELDTATDTEVASAARAALHDLAKARDLRTCAKELEDHAREQAQLALGALDWQGAHEVGVGTIRVKQHTSVRTDQKVIQAHLTSAGVAESLLKAAYAAGQTSTTSETVEFRPDKPAVGGAA